MMDGLPEVGVGFPTDAFFLSGGGTGVTEGYRSVFVPFVSFSETDRATLPLRFLRYLL